MLRNKKLLTFVQIIVEKKKILQRISKNVRLINSGV